jgi:hypothetical protein
MAQKMCLQCGSIGDTKRFMKGSILTELILWLFLLLPGLIYSIWRHSTVAQVCSKCESPNVIPLDSPVARNLMANQPKAPAPDTSNASTARDNRISPKKALVIVGVMVALLLIVIISLNSTSGQSSSVTAAPSLSPAIAPVSTTPRIASKSTGNEANDRLLALPKSEQASMLGKVAGEGCVGNRAFYMGISKVRTASWSVGCTDGNSYAVQIDADSVGTTTILECSILKAVAKVNCFEKFATH